MMYGNGDGTCNAPLRGRREGKSFGGARDKRRLVITFASAELRGCFPCCSHPGRWSPTKTPDPDPFIQLSEGAFAAGSVRRRTPVDHLGSCDGRRSAPAKPSPCRQARGICDVACDLILRLCDIHITKPGTEPQSTIRTSNKTAEIRRDPTATGNSPAILRGNKSSRPRRIQHRPPGDQY